MVTLHSPAFISSRLMPALKIGGTTLSLDYSDWPGDGGRDRYFYALDFHDGREYTGEDLQSGCGGGTLHEGFESFLDFLASAGDGYAYRLSHPSRFEDDELFPEWVAEWAYQHTDAIESLLMDLENDPHIFVEQ